MHFPRHVTIAEKNPPKTPTQKRKMKHNSTWVPWVVPCTAFSGRETLQRSFSKRAASSKICCTVWIFVEKLCSDAWSGTCIIGLETCYILCLKHYENVILINGLNPVGMISYLWLCTQLLCATKANLLVYKDCWIMHYLRISGREGIYPNQ